MRERHNPGTDSLALIPLCKMSNLVTLMFDSVFRQGAGGMQACTPPIDVCN